VPLGRNFRGTGGM